MANPCSSLTSLNLSVMPPHETEPPLGIKRASCAGPSAAQASDSVTVEHAEVVAGPVTYDLYMINQIRLHCCSANEDDPAPRLIWKGLGPERGVNGSFTPSGR